MRLVLLLLTFVMAACRPALDTTELSADIDSLLGQYPEATAAISIRDDETGVAFDLNGDRSFHAASTMKVPVMIEVFRRVERGDFALEDQLPVVNEFRSIVDGSSYAIGDDSDDAIYTMLGTSIPIRRLVDRMITVSSNLATNLLIDFVNADSVQTTSERMGTRSMQTLRGVEDLKAFDLGMSNSTTSSDLALLLEALRDGHAVSESADREMVDVLLRQELNEMIPAGLPNGVNVAHKTGQITSIHHDAAIVYPSDAPPYVLVILIEGIADDTRSAALGSGIARLVHGHLRPQA